MFKHLSLSCILLATISATSSWAAPKGPKVGRVKYAVDPALKSTGSCAADAAWSGVRNGADFRQMDCFKTGDGGSLQFLKIRLSILMSLLKRAMMALL